MNATEQTRLTPLYAALLRALLLQDKAEKTVEAYARAIRRSADFFDRCPDEVTAEDVQTYFAALLKFHSWSTVKLDRCDLAFFYLKSAIRARRGRFPAHGRVPAETKSRLCRGR